MNDFEVVDHAANYEKEEEMDTQRVTIMISGGGATLDVSPSEAVALFKGMTEFTGVGGERVFVRTTDVQMAIVMPKVPSGLVIAQPEIRGL